VATPKQLYERPRTRFVADFVGVNNFIPGTCREVTPDGAVVETALGPLRALGTADVATGARCVLAVRPENVALGAGAADANVVEARVVLASYLGNTLRYDVEAAGGLLLKVDVRDPWHHEPVATGAADRLTFPPTTALTLADD
jgi:ABC-type Fe3+/spermidine/putrescine transport system ATPase subunit